MIKHVVEDLTPFRGKRKRYEGRPEEIEEILAEGNRKAQEQATQTMDEVRSVLGL
jgi:tryptophanyl-tRNA synthetase